MNAKKTINWSNRQLHIILHLIFWLIISTLFIMVTGNFYSLKIALLRTASNLICLAVLFYGNIYLLVNQFLEKKRYWEYIVGTLVFFTLIISLRLYLNSFFPDYFYQPFIKNLYKPLIGDNLLPYLLIFITSLGILIFSILYQVLVNRAATERETMNTIHQYHQAQIQFLKAQINPHFLFNTLNNIYSLAILKSDETPKMILKLSDLLRYVIYKGEAKKVSLEEEVVHIQKFIDLFQMSQEEDLNIVFLTEGNLSSIKVEPMILIPLVENCFKHCDFNTNPNAFIELHLILEDKQLIFKTVNSKNNTDHQKDKTGGVGLVNIRKRLSLNYGTDYTLEQINTNTNFTIHLTLPIQTNA